MLVTGDAGVGDASLAGLKVLVIEDEFLITMLLEDILDDLGCTLAGSATNIRQAAELVADVTADAAILDVNLGGDPVFPIAQSLTERQVPIIFASGYGSTTLPERWQNFPTLPKPFTAEQVATALRAVVAGR